MESPKYFLFKLAKEQTHHLLFFLKPPTRAHHLFPVTATFSMDMPLLLKPKQQEMKTWARHIIIYKHFVTFSKTITKKKILRRW